MNLFQKPIDSAIQLAKTASKTVILEKTIGCFFETIGCLYQFTNIKTEFKEIKDRENAHRGLYRFTLKPRATSSSQKPLGNPLSNQYKLHTKPPKK